MDKINIKGIIFDYGGTIDSRAVHWSEVIWKGYLNAGVNITKEQFRDCYVFAERELARVRHILPNDTFLDLLRKKMAIELGNLVDNGIIAEAPQSLCESIAQYCYNAARECVEEARPILETLSSRYPMMLVSNFYGNVDSVLRDFDLRRYFKGVIESAVVGVRKPNPTLFRLGVDAREMEAADVLVVGDSITKDIVPAESLGCKVLWIKGKGWTADEDAQTHPCMITSITQVPDCINM
ncbi:MAG: HAD family hydrolase [Bacteroidales bacterium]|nr:HAD family hydrolase [Candidatus Sodaliphilus aphodohippi]